MKKFLRDEEGEIRITTVDIIAFVVIAVVFACAWFLPVGQIQYSISQVLGTGAPSASVIAGTRGLEASTTPEVSVEPVGPKVTHIKTPDPLKAIYMSSWAAGHHKFRAHLFDLVDTTEINAVMIDVKDYSGKISFEMSDPEIVATGAIERRIPDIKELIAKLHEKGVYVIARISVFQDSYLINVHPDWAVKTESGEIWQDYKGVKWLDAGAKPVWDYVVKIGKESYAVGFDELNFDYIRYPSDGNLKDIAYTWSEGRPRTEVIRTFFAYLHDQFKGTGIPISAD